MCVCVSCLCVTHTVCFLLFRVRVIRDVRECCCLRVSHGVCVSCFLDVNHDVRLFLTSAGMP